MSGNAAHHADTRAETRRRLDDIKRRPLAELIGKRTKLKKMAGGKHTGLCPLHSESTPSFWIYPKGNYYCYGCSSFGDAVTFLRHMDGLDFWTALERAEEFFGLRADASGIRKKTYAQRGAPTPEQEGADREWQEANARSMWRAALPASGTVVEYYLREHRRIAIEHLPGGKIPETLRFIPACPYWHDRKLIAKFPAMAAPLQDQEDVVRGIHLTFLDPVTGNKIALRDPDDLAFRLPAKKMKGTAFGCAIRLAHRADYMAASEGIENGLAAMMCGSPPCWVAASLNNLAGRGIGEGEPHPRLLDRRLPSVYPDMASPAFSFPAGTKRGLQIQDNDSRDQESADKLFERGMRRWNEQGIAPEKFTPDRKMDMNDMVIKGKAGPGSFGGAA